MQRPTFAQIDLGVLVENLRALRSLLKPGVELIGVVKANAYGHGAVEVSGALAAQGIERLAVAVLNEAIQLHEAEIPVRIVLLGSFFPDEVGEIVSRGIEPVVGNLPFAEALSREAVRQNRTVAVHLKFDTGMGRIGFPQEHAVETAVQVAALPGLKIENAMTHFPSADVPAEAAFTREQVKALSRIRTELKEKGISVPCWHAANSAGIFWFPESQFDAVRPGISLFGGVQKYSEPCPVALRLVMSLRTRIAQIRNMAPGATVSYARTFEVNRPSRIALLSLGYADGFDRRHSNTGEVLIHGKRAPVVGRVCMDMTMVDVTDIPQACVGDEVIAYGTQGEETIDINRVAETLQTIPHTIMTGITARVPRVYVNGP